MNLLEEDVGSTALSDLGLGDDTYIAADGSHCTTTSYKEHCRWKAKWCERWCNKKTGWKKMKRLPVFRDFHKDDAIAYDDWWCEVDTLMQCGQAHKKIKLAVLDALEGRPKWMAQVADTDNKGHVGKGSLFKILDVLENCYRCSVMYHSLLGELCSIWQKRVKCQKHTMNNWQQLFSCYENNTVTISKYGSSV